MRPAPLSSRISLISKSLPHLLSLLLPLSSYASYLLSARFLRKRKTGYFPYREVAGCTTSLARPEGAQIAKGGLLSASTQPLVFQPVV